MSTPPSMSMCSGQPPCGLPRLLGYPAKCAVTTLWFARWVGSATDLPEAAEASTGSRPAVLEGHPVAGRPGRVTLGVSMRKGRPGEVHTCERGDCPDGSGPARPPLATPPRWGPAAGTPVWPRRAATQRPSYGCRLRILPPSSLWCSRRGPTTTRHSEIGLMTPSCGPVWRATAQRHPSRLRGSMLAGKLAWLRAPLAVAAIPGAGPETAANHEVSGRQALSSTMAERPVSKRSILRGLAVPSRLYL